MKKILILTVLVALCIGLNAQREHMKFMGIDMNCDIDSFKEKLIQKGFQIDEKFTGDDDPSIALNGTFFNEDACLFVEYDENSKLVNSVKVTIVCLKEIAKNKYQNFKNGFLTKYADHYCNEGSEPGKEYFGVLLLDKNKNEYGGITMKIVENTYATLPDIAILLIGYVDLKNKELHEKKKYEDL